MIVASNDINEDTLRSLKEQVSNNKTGFLPSPPQKKSCMFCIAMNISCVGLHVENVRLLFVIQRFRTTSGQNFQHLKENVTFKIMCVFACYGSCRFHQTDRIRHSGRSCPLHAIWAFLTGDVTEFKLSLCARIGLTRNC